MYHPAAGQRPRRRQGQSGKTQSVGCSRCRGGRQRRTGHFRYPLGKSENGSGDLFENRRCGSGRSGRAFAGNCTPTGIVSKLRDPEAAQKVRAFIQALGGAANIQRVDACAETRHRLVLEQETAVDETALNAAGVQGVMRLANRTLHLLVGLNADQYAAEMKGQLASA
ncbi:MAG: PTS transporter subunit EIIB [Candidatus Competibacteraceae bacterium]